MGPDSDKERPRFHIGDVVEVTDPYGRHQGHKGPIVQREWAVDVWRFAPSWKYKLEKCDRFFRAYQLKRLITESEKRAELHRLIDMIPDDRLAEVKQALELLSVDRLR